jgi:hypothetical protein
MDRLIACLKPTKLGIMLWIALVILWSIGFGCYAIHSPHAIVDQQGNIVRIESGTVTYSTAPYCTLSLLSHWPNLLIASIILPNVSNTTYLAIPLFATYAYFVSVLANFLAYRFASVESKLSARKESLGAEHPLPQQPPTGSKFCRQCGKPLRAGSKFCLSCGGPVRKR